MDPAIDILGNTLKLLILGEPETQTNIFLFFSWQNKIPPSNLTACESMVVSMRFKLTMSAAAQEQRTPSFLWALFHLKL